MGGWSELAIRWLVHRPREVAADRGQSQVIGAILIFGFVIAGLGLYQISVVPQQNGEVELDHSQDVDTDFDDVHSAITNAGSANDLRTASVKLGTRYPPRALTLNPAPVSGRIAISDLSGSIDASGFSADDVCGSTATSPKTLTYKANYNELNGAGQHGYETSVTYKEANGEIVDSSQVLIQGTTIRLLPLTTGTVSTASVTSETLEFEGGETGGTTLTNTAPTITLPTDLSENQWETILDDVDGVDDGDITKTGDRVSIDLPTDTYEVRCTAIGEGKTPTNLPAVTPGSGTSNPGGGINPNGPGEVAYSSASMDGNNGVEITFENLDSQPRTIEEARVPFYASDGQGGSGGDPGEKVDIKQDGDPFEEIGGPYVSRSDVTIQPGSTDEIELDFFCDDESAYTVGEGDYFVVSLKFQNGETNNYFINPPATNSGNNPCGGSDDNNGMGMG